MSEDVIICDKCGTPNPKGNDYCTNCGTLLGVGHTTPSTKKKKLIYKPYHKVIIFFAIVIIVDLILSVIVMSGFSIPGSGYFPIFVGLFFLSLIVVGIFWGIGASGGVDAGAAEGCGYVIGGIIAVAIAIPLWIFTVLGPIATGIGEAIGEAIGDAIENAFRNFFSELFEGIEIPGFEPFLFIAVFIILSLVTVYGYHLRAKRNK